LVKDRVNLEEEIIGRAVAIVKPLAARKGLYLRYSPSADLPSILADPVRLRQVLLNLFTNSVRLTEQGGIEVTARQEGQEILVSVRDSGPGIAPEARQQLFREFGQIPSEPGSSPGGSGLGLAISKSLVELHGGRIWVDSEPGSGSTFSFTLPLPGAQPLAGDLVRTAAASALKSERTCLVVLDNEHALRALARYLEGYRIVGVPSPDGLRSFIKDLKPQAILTTPSQVELVAEQIPPTAHVPIITCGLPKAPRLRGVISYLVKPIAPNALTAVVKGLHKEEATILLVDDEVDALRLMERMLTGIPHPYRILKASSGEQAFAIMAESLPDLVIADLLMPELSGEEMIARMRGDERLRGVPIAVVSAQDPSGAALRISSPLSVHSGIDLDLASAAKQIVALLDMLSPHYAIISSTT
ncbi:MAG: response regulator, partial [Anaerolineales bacterium]|nr:response regulator [Anaerolineales bacterium]